MVFFFGFLKCFNLFCIFFEDEMVGMDVIWYGGLVYIYYDNFDYGMYMYFMNGYKCFDEGFGGNFVGIDVQIR